MNYIEKFFILKILLFGQSMLYSQVQIPLYKMVMNSDAILIVESKDYKYINNPKNEFYTEHYIIFENILDILKNQYSTNFKNFKVRVETNGNDFYQNINGEYCYGIGSIVEKDKKYFDIFFLKKREKQYYVIAHLWNNISANTLHFFRDNIEEINLISKERYLYKKKEKIEAWFKSSNRNHPDEYVIATPFTEEFIQFFENKN
ncbi:hypothetical protein PG637_02350 [Riemerella anatipestifer]|nr:hypothetical protein [Riemerella anatipestifer]MDY3324512.1 hypothetical protein [Riemerella anatipestifer]MDY3353323.1 hypothetical protein [Riemerella anatipestifer]